MNLFDRFAAWTTRLVSSPLFFAATVLSVVLWTVTGPIFGWSDTHQLVINTFTTIVTYWLVALLQNSQQRFEDATLQALREISRGIADLLDEVDRKDASRLREVMGVLDETLPDDLSE